MNRSVKTSGSRRRPAMGVRSLERNCSPDYARQASLNPPKETRSMNRSVKTNGLLSPGNVESAPIHGTAESDNLTKGGAKRLKTPSNGENNLKTPSNGENNLKTPSNGENNLKTPTIGENNLKTPSNDTAGASSA